MLPILQDEKPRRRGGLLGVALALTTVIAAGGAAAYWTWTGGDVAQLASLVSSTPEREPHAAPSGESASTPPASSELAASPSTSGSPPAEPEGASNSRLAARPPASEPSDEPEPASGRQLATAQATSSSRPASLALAAVEPPPHTETAPITEPAEPPPEPADRSAEILARIPDTADTALLRRWAADSSLSRDARDAASARLVRFDELGARIPETSDAAQLRRWADDGELPQSIRVAASARLAAFQDIERQIPSSLEMAQLRLWAQDATLPRALRDSAQTRFAAFETIQNSVATTSDTDLLGRWSEDETLPEEIRAAARSRSATLEPPPTRSLRNLQSFVDTCSPAAVCPRMVPLVGNNRSITAFAIAQTEVTNREWSACVDEGRCPALDLEPALSPADKPAVKMSYSAATGYAAWLSEKTGQTYRLPSDEEWEYAAVIAGLPPYACLDASKCSHREGSPAAATAGPAPKDRQQLQNIVGNVAEWTQGSVARGGSYRQRGPAVSISASMETSRNGAADTGFRLVRETPEGVAP